MEQLTFKDVLRRGIKEVIVQSYGYEEGRINPYYQPFGHKRNITFEVVCWEPTEIDSTLDGYLSHKTFWIKGNEADLTYILEDGKVYLDDPDLGADIDY